MKQRSISFIYNIVRSDNESENSIREKGCTEYFECVPNVLFSYAGAGIDLKGLFVSGLINAQDNIDDNNFVLKFDHKNEPRGSTKGVFISPGANVFFGTNTHKGIYLSGLVNLLSGASNGYMVSSINIAEYVGQGSLTQCGLINKVHEVEKNNLENITENYDKSFLFQFGMSNKVSIVPDGVTIVQVGLRNIIGNKSFPFINYKLSSPKKKSLEDNVETVTIEKPVINTDSDNLPFNIVSDEPKPNDYSHLNSQKDR